MFCINVCSSTVSWSNTILMLSLLNREYKTNIVYYWNTWNKIQKLLSIKIMYFLYFFIVSNSNALINKPETNWQKKDKCKIRLNTTYVIVHCIRCSFSVPLRWVNAIKVLANAFKIQDQHKKIRKHCFRKLII